MLLTTNQKIFFGSILLIVLILVLGFLGIIPGIKKQTDPNRNLKFTLNVWVFGENASDLNSYNKEFKKLFPKSSIVFKSFDDYEKYEDVLLNALAEGRGPDIFMIKNTDVKKYLTKIYPASNEVYSLINLRNDFPYIVEQDVFHQGGVYGLPISVDVLSLIYNRDLFDQNNILNPPQTWDEFLNSLLLIEKDENGRIKGAAIGSVSLKNVPTAKDLFFLLMLQKNISGRFKDSFSEVAKFYLSFSDFLNEYYTWDDKYDYKKAFLENKVAMIFDYYSFYQKLLKEKNNILIDKIPQFDLNNKINLASYYVFVVSKQSKFKNLAWKFILSLSLNDAYLSDYLDKNNKLPILKKIINKKSQNINVEKIKYQVLTARSLNFINDLSFTEKEIFDKLSLLRNDRISFEEFVDYMTNLIDKK